MENSFLQKRGEKRDHRYILTKFNVIKKKSGEDISDLTKIFNKLYNNMLAEIKPPQTIARVVFARDFDSKFGFTLRERESSILDQIKIDALEVEVNYTSTRKFRGRSDLGEKKKGKEEHLPKVEENSKKRG